MSFPLDGRGRGPGKPGGFPGGKKGVRGGNMVSPAGVSRRRTTGVEVEA